jgi:hypothetical protein
MKLLGTRKWKKSNRTEKINKIIVDLNKSDIANVTYYKGRSYLLSLLLGRGHLKSVNEENEWNYVRVEYQGKIAFELFFSFLGCDGRFFNENYTNDEINNIKKTLDNAEIYIQYNLMKLYEYTRFLTIPAIFIGSANSVYSIISNNYSDLFIHLFYLIPFILIFLLASWKRNLNK